MKILRFHQYIKESTDTSSLYRNTDIKWLLSFLKKGISTPLGSTKRFISFSNNENSGGMDNFGDVCIVFDSNELYKQGAIDVYYEKDFFEENPDICLYVTGYKSEDNYYQQHDYKDADDFNENGQDDMDLLSWETVIEDYEHESEVVIKKLTYNDKLIKHIIVSDELNKKDSDVIKKFGIDIIYP